jgi:Na+/proline symporter
MPSPRTVAQAGATFDKGFATIWFQWKNMLITPLYWLMAPWYRRSERTTVAEIIADRYGRKLAAAYTLFAIAFTSMLPSLSPAIARSPSTAHT